MNEDFDVVIIGAGPAGLFCAINCAGKGARVCILEKNARPGKKLLITGSGQCNITHEGPVEELLSHYGDKANFVKPALYGFTNEDLTRFFAARNLQMTADDNGKLFPESRRAADVLNVLLEECRAKGVEMRTDEPVQEIGKFPGGFIIRTEKNQYRARFTVITTGGKSYPGTGSTGDGYGLAAALGHSIVEPAPALVPLAIEDYRLSRCSGISLPGCAVGHYRNGKRVGLWKGDVLFTHTGLSGPAILDNSRYVLPGDELKLALVAFESAGDFDRDLVARLSAHGRKTVKNVLGVYGVPDRLAVEALESTGIAPDTVFSRLDRESRKIMARSFTGFPCRVRRAGSFNEAMATRGGVALVEISGRTMESKKTDGLFFAGEVVDVDGDTGGYNLQWAISSGCIAGRSIARLMDKKSSVRD